IHRQVLEGAPQQPRKSSPHIRQILHDQAAHHILSVAFVHQADFPIGCKPGNGSSTRTCVPASVPSKDAVPPSSRTRKRTLLSPLPARSPRKPTPSSHTEVWS